MNKEKIAKGMLEQVKIVKAKKREILSISNVPPVLHQAFSDLAISKKLPHNKLFAEIFYHYLNFPFELSCEESLVMQEAHKIAPNTLGKKISNVPPVLHQAFSGVFVNERITVKILFCKRGY